MDSVIFFLGSLFQGFYEIISYKIGGFISFKDISLAFSIIYGVIWLFDKGSFTLHSSSASTSSSVGSTNLQNPRLKGGK